MHRCPGSASAAARHCLVQLARCVYVSLSSASSLPPISASGAHCTQSIITRLPYGQNNLGISESTAVALLCTLMELCMGSLDNCRYTHTHTHTHTHSHIHTHTHTCTYSHIHTHTHTHTHAHAHPHLLCMVICVMVSSLSQIPQRVRRCTCCCQADSVQGTHTQDHLCSSQG